MAPFHMALGGIGGSFESGGALRPGRMHFSPPAGHDRRRGGGYAGVVPTRRKKVTSGRSFTVEFPKQLEAEKRGDAWWAEVDGRELRLSNLDKVFWPDEGYTKGDLVAFYHNVAPTLLPYLEDRPLTMKRMPDGITGPFFYEKNAPSHTPDWMGRCRVESEEAEEGFNDFLVAQDAAGVL